jgi:SAM-dependent methyltransferase
VEKTFKDFFSKQSKGYAASRPTYPELLFDFLAGLADRRGLAWDCATGNGQAALALSKRFKQVIASDLSRKQIENAAHKNNIRYEVFPAEEANIKDNSVDLITVAQALHWFNLDRFYAEARRVLRKNGVIAAWTYGLHSVSPAVDRVVYQLYEDILGKYWPEERRHIENRYDDLPFPFERIAAPEFAMELDWDLSQVVGYLHTWSSVQKYAEQNSDDPVKKIEGSLEAAWGKEKKRKVTWPLYVKVGRLS